MYGVLPAGSGAAGVQSAFFAGSISASTLAIVSCSRLRSAESSTDRSEARTLDRTAADSCGALARRCLPRATPAPLAPPAASVRPSSMPGDTCGVPGEQQDVFRAE